MRFRGALVLSVSLFVMFVSVQFAFSENSKTKKSIAVLSFENLTSKDIARIGKLTGNFVQQSIKSVTKVDRKNIERIINEQKLQISGAVDERTAIQLGNLLGIKWLLTGAITKIQRQVKKTACLSLYEKRTFIHTAAIEGRLINLETGSIDFSETTESVIKNVNTKIFFYNSDDYNHQGWEERIIEKAARNLAQKLDNYLKTAK